MHQVASSYIEGKIGEEMAKHSKAFLMMGGCVVHIEDKLLSCRKWVHYWLRARQGDQVSDQDNT